MTLKKFFLIRPEILGLFVNTLTANYEYSRRNIENLPLKIQTNLSEKPLYFRGTFFQFLESTLNFQCSEKKHDRLRSYISEVIDSERCAYLNVKQGLFLQPLWQ